MLLRNEEFCLRCILTEKKFHKRQHTMTMLAFFNIKIETFHVFFLVLFKKSRNKKVLSNLCDLFWLLSIQCQNFAIFFNYKASNMSE